MIAAQGYPENNQPGPMIIGNDRRTPMSNKQISGRFFETYGKQHDTEAAALLFAPEARIYSTAIPGGSADVAGYKQVGEMFLAAFPDISTEVIEQIEEGDKVVSYVMWSGTQTGPLLSIPPTGKKFRSEGITIDRVVDGKIAERHEVADLMTMMQQLGVIPALA
jgi:predicted ester cyclase